MIKFNEKAAREKVALLMHNSVGQSWIEAMTRLLVEQHAQDIKDFHKLLNGIIKLHMKHDDYGVPVIDVEDLRKYFDKEKK